MSIEKNIDRIADALEKLVELKASEASVINVATIDKPADPVKHESHKPVETPDAPPAAEDVPLPPSDTEAPTPPDADAKEVLAKTEAKFAETNNANAIFDLLKSFGVNGVQELDPTKYHNYLIELEKIKAS